MDFYFPTSSVKEYQVRSLIHTGGASADLTLMTSGLTPDQKTAEKEVKKLSDVIFPWEKCAAPTGMSKERGRCRFQCSEGQQTGMESRKPE